MRFKQFLEQAPSGVHTLEVGLDDAVEFFRDNPAALELLKKDTNYLYRGQGQDPADFMYGDSRTFTRKAANTLNYVNAFISASPEWKAYPKRSSSFVCSTHPSGAGGYGFRFVAFPADEAKVAICDAGDFWDAFSETAPHANIHKINEFLDRFPVVLPRNNGENLRAALENIDEAKLKEIIDSDSTGWVTNAVQFFLDFMKKFDAPNMKVTLDKMFDPHVNKIVTSTGKNLDHLLQAVPDRSEAWIEGRTLFVKYGLEGKNFFELRKQLLKELA